MKKKIILIKPHITEQSLNLADTENQYTFIVDNKSNKIEIRKIVEKKFDVEVEKVRICNYLGKKVSFGKKRIKGRKKSFKKAIISLKAGDSIGVFKIK